MVQAYNFLASWQLFPEKCDFEYQTVPKSGNYKIETVPNGHLLSFSHNWVNLENDAFYAQYQVNPNGQPMAFDNIELANTKPVTFTSFDGTEIHGYFTAGKNQTENRAAQN